MLRTQAAASAPATDAGNNVLGEGIRRTYDIGTDQTIRWGVLKSKVVPPPAKNGKEQTWQQYRKSTEKDRQALRKQFAERLEVIAYPERKRRRNVGIALGAGAWDVDDTGLEYMPSKDVAERIQKKVLSMYIRDSVISTGLLSAFCFWPL